MFARWPRLRRLLRWTGATILLIFVLLAGIYLLRDRLLAEPLANFVAEQMSEALGGRFSLERIEGDYFTELVVIGKSGAVNDADLRSSLDRCEAGMGRG